MSSSTQRAATPKSLAVPLLAHQEIALDWMQRQERGTSKGGILADEMGLGKTLSTISLILACSSTEKHKTNLIVCPVSLIKQWEQEIKSKLKPDYQLKVSIFHGEKRAPASELMEHDVVLTSYGTLLSERKKLNDFWKKNVDRKIDVKNDVLLKQCASFLHPWDSHFHRIILDESHHIKNRLAQTSEAVTEVKAKYRWCLTGTPMMNGVDDMYAMYRFLKISPYDDWGFFVDSFGTLFDTKTTGADPKVLAMKNFQVLLKATMLRRSKSSMLDGKPILVLPEKTEENVEVVLSVDEFKFYQEVQEKSQVIFSQYLGGTKTIGWRFGHVLVLLLRLRQACCHPFLLLNSEQFIPEVDAEMLERAERLPEGQVNRILHFKCRDCSTTIADPIFIYPCAHEICVNCLAKLVPKASNAQVEQTKCPVCKGPLDKNTVITYDAFKQIHAPELRPSSKVNVCIDLLRRIQKETGGEKSKTLVFSQWTMLLDCLEVALREDDDETMRNLKTVRYDGCMTMTLRDKVVRKFRDDPDVRVMFLSLRAGNAGLNLVAATRVIIMEPFWNPYIEMQAVDRAHRIGQKKPVKVYRLHAQGTVEDRIMKLQEAKKSTINAALDEKAHTQVSSLSLDELKYLFNLA
ncbi:hypothetical protein SODALDRAFT_340815 [Sodiomyces alkalinus F11]|uniref:Uncharacterized protein n=1 Tax=Sodiomyces alkalinus (strain CBS 110278 / VKM F-3762 / F11) TaxID=1314773 RepID=A0A3N2PT70_SODAK|nr:hypothetical protein SODALDRAFT_340815 [Sodiomyces alkalinus F11]ROT37614.1 hypothetical protein SODALDRAFT_340815 [Sodiomyces alkalinus F11]